MKNNYAYNESSEYTINNLRKEISELKDLLKLIVNRDDVVLDEYVHYNIDTYILGINGRYVISKKQYEILDKLRTDVIIKVKE